MKMWSQGLGKNELVVDFRKYKVVEETNKDNVRETIIKGITSEPVQWEFQIRVYEEDLPGFLNVFFKPATLFFVFRNIHRVFLFFFLKLFKKEQFVEMDIKK
jgi:hypothetical protein